VAGTEEQRPKPITGKEGLRWLVQTLLTTDVGALHAGRPGDLPNLVYDMRRWLDLEQAEPASRELRQIQRQPQKLREIVDVVARLFEAVADGKRFRVSYERGSATLDASKLGPEDSRALSYRDACLRDAVVRVALDDIVESGDVTRLIRRCPECRKVFFAARKSQRFCGSKCSNLTHGRNFREKRAGELREREVDRYWNKRPHRKVRYQAHVRARRSEVDYPALDYRMVRR
jgi:ribosomal protein S27AE